MDDGASSLSFFVVGGSNLFINKILIWLEREKW